MNTPSRRYPISERFTSQQGEGFWSGKVMDFIRVGGCSVGKKFPKEMYKDRITGGYAPDLIIEKGLPIWQEECHTWDGRSFPCDTNYQTKQMMTIEELQATHPINVQHFCLTGGEPMNFDLASLCNAFFDPGNVDFRFHVETSGTVSMKKAFGESHALYDDVWITVSPKQGVLPEMLQRANEIKLLVDENFDPKKVEELLRPCEDSEYQYVLSRCSLGVSLPIVWLSPINDTKDFKKSNQDLAVALTKEHPEWRMMSQLHKLWGVL